MFSLAPAERDLPDEAANGSMRAVETGQSAVQARVVRVLGILTARGGVVGSVALIINRLRPGVRTQEIQPTRKALFDFRLKSMINRVSAVR